MRMMKMPEIEATWSLIGKIGAVIALIVAMIKGVQFLYSLSPSSKLEKRVDKLEEHLAADFEHLKEIDAKIQRLTEKVEATDGELKQLTEGINRIGKSQISLLRHFVSGNGQAEMQKEAEDLTEFFIDRS